MAEKRSSTRGIPEDTEASSAASFLERVGALLLAYQEQLLAWQHETLNIMAAEASFYQAGALTAMRAALPLVAGREEQWQRMVGLSATGWRLAADMQAALLHAFSLSLPAPGAVRDAAAPNVDRRSKSVVINFPDRRSA